MNFVIWISLFVLIVVISVLTYFLVKHHGSSVVQEEIMEEVFMNGTVAGSGYTKDTSGYIYYVTVKIPKSERRGWYPKNSCQDLSKRLACFTQEEDEFIIPTPKKVEPYTFDPIKLAYLKSDPDKVRIV